MIFRQRDQLSNKSQSIEGRKINNSITCNIKETRTLNPHINQMMGPEETFETDSFKQILTKRSNKPNNKENVSSNGYKLKRIKEETTMRSKKIKNKEKNEQSKGLVGKKKNNKTSTASLNKLFRMEKSKDEKSRKHRKSYSPQRQLKNYRSGPQNQNVYVVQSKHISNYTSKNNRQLVNQRSEKALTERVKNNPKSLEVTQREGKGKGVKKQQKKEEKKGIKKRKNVSKANLLIKKGHGQSVGKLQQIAKQFDGMVKLKKKKTKKQLNKTSREKKVIISNNNSHHMIEKPKKNNYQFSDDSFDTSRNVLQRKYSHNKVQKKKQRLSFDPIKRKKKESKKIKTQCLSPTKEDGTALKIKNVAATMIQKNFRGYITRKYLDEFRTVMKAVINIQRCWRGYQARKYVQRIRDSSYRSKNSLSKRLMIESPQKIHELLHSSISKAQTPQVEQITNLLEEILFEENVNEKIKQKIVTILNREAQKSSARSSIKNHSEAQIQSERLFFKDIKEKQIEKEKKSKLSSPSFGSPKLDKTHLLQSPEIMVENLLTIQQFHKQKLISNANLQKQGINQLAMKKLFSPRTSEAKRKQIDEKLNSQLSKFEVNMDQILKSCRGNELLDEKVKPFSGLSTPEHIKNMQQIPQDGMNSSQRKIQDLSMELLDYYDDNHSVQKKSEQLQNLDTTYLFIQDYLINLFEYIRQTKQQFKTNFIIVMKKDKNLKPSVILKNLIVITEDSEEDDFTFKLPMYKYLQNNEIELITKEISQQFNETYQKLLRNQKIKKHNLQDIYLKLLIDCINEAFYNLRPSSYIFTQVALRSQRMKVGIHNSIQNQQYPQLDTQFSYYFALAMETVYRWANLNCGMVVTQQIDQGALVMLNQTKTKQFLKMEASQEWIYYDQLLQVIVSLSDAILDEVMLQQGSLLYGC